MPNNAHRHPAIRERKHCDCSSKKKRLSKKTNIHTLKIQGLHCHIHRRLTVIVQLPAPTHTKLHKEKIAVFKKNTFLKTLAPAPDNALAITPTSTWQILPPEKKLSSKNCAIFHKMKQRSVSNIISGKKAFKLVAFIKQSDSLCPLQF